MKDGTMQRGSQYFFWKPHLAHAPVQLYLRRFDISFYGRLSQWVTFGS